MDLVWPGAVRLTSLANRIDVMAIIVALCFVFQGANDALLACMSCRELHNELSICSHKMGDFWVR